MQEKVVAPHKTQTRVTRPVADVEFKHLSGTLIKYTWLKGKLIRYRNNKLDIGRRGITKLTYVLEVDSDVHNGVEVRDQSGKRGYIHPKFVVKGLTEMARAAGIPYQLVGD